MSSAGLLVAHAVGGGRPPASSETLRLYANGVARAVVGNAWPFGAPQHEAGSYEHEVAPRTSPCWRRRSRSRTGSTRRARRPPTAVAGSCDSATGAGRCGRRPPRRRPGWPRSSSACAASPPRRGATRWVRSRCAWSRPWARRRERRSSSGSRSTTPAPRRSGSSPAAHCGCGRPPRRRVRREAGRTSRRSSPRSRSRSRPRRSRTPSSAGERRTIAARTAIATPGRWRLDVLALLTAALPYEGASLRLGCVMLAGPVVVAVSG